MRTAQIAAVGLILAACGSTGGPRPADLPDLPDLAAGRIAWTARLGISDGYVFAPAQNGEVLYAAGRDGRVLRIDSPDGRIGWQIALGVAQPTIAQREPFSEPRALWWREAPGLLLSGGVAASAELVVVAEEKGEIWALDAGTGRVRWRARASSEVLATPAIGGGLVVVRAADGRVFAYSAEDGSRRWVYQRAVPALSLRSPAGVALHGDLAYVGFPGGKLVALALASGAVRWEATVALPKGATELERITDVVGEPVVMGREVCAAAYQGRVACYDALTGGQTWARDLSSVTGVSLDAGYAYVSDDRGAVYALDRTNGRTLWKQDRLGNRQLTVPVPLGSEVAVADLEGVVHFLSRDSGAFTARAITGGYPVVASPLRYGSGLLIQNAAGGLYAVAR